METNNFIQVNGIMSQGYGFSPKAVMRDTRLTIEAKAIYSYMSSFAGSGLTAFPTIELQLHELGISKSRYYKHRKLLEDLGYITIKQTRVKGTNGKVVNGKNIYTIEQFPVEKEEVEVPQNKESHKTIENTTFSEVTQNETPQNSTAQNVESNSNNLNSNNLNSNNISSSSKEDEEEVKKLLEICQLQEFKLSKKDIKALLVVYSFDKIAKAIITAGSTDSTIKNYKGYLVSVLNDMEKVKKVDININNKDSKKSNANFTQREQDMNELEKQLLGWEE
ncbi:TPA: helix-turn-helix domain-containing protein [Clostridium perfringens]|uniref:Helix-turn-helix domain-containing protein n=2 Tax=Clostridium perfringens TaxID=1502 RepID=A0AAN5SGB8_CLOPF|nr:helix-turn-helix domain-containing protein [Clostridium perfringens]QTZ83012.1 putative DNA-binding protein [Clostridium phage vB_CpeS-1181]AQW28516.1 helix-turn-helix domain-containing protein [Clostridium perfringens]PWW86595.1 helix-turn-helix domain-containing protein [Clostridium perfringens]PWW90368.1 helix-turn-helix domain-containing protein [Clostridium perfringens]PWX64967.1 helix-turn-helix domain-containing protein [Clostridium perfringens]